MQGSIIWTGNINIELLEIFFTLDYAVFRIKHKKGIDQAQIESE